MRTELVKPFIKVFLYKMIILQKGIGSANPIDLLGLSRRKVFVRIETPATFKQSLPAENFVNPGNTAAKMMGGIKDGRIRVGNLMTQAQKIAGD
jgi:hypothetical protein